MNKQQTLLARENLCTKKPDIDMEARRKLNNQKNKVLWFTGLSGAGKSTIANSLEKALYEQGVMTYLLEGDSIRQTMNNDLGFCERDRTENIRRIAEVARLMYDAGIMVIIATISPFLADREAARALFPKGDFIEIYVDTPLQLAISRDPKGLYKKVRDGHIKNFTGIHSPYEIPKNPDFRLQTENNDVGYFVRELLGGIEY